MLAVDIQFAECNPGEASRCCEALPGPHPADPAQSLGAEQWDDLIEDTGQVPVINSCPFW